ncbi:MAG: sortase domain-containing protein [Methanobacterium sp.]
MNKYIIVVIIVIIATSFILISSQATAQVATKTYKNGEISLNIPADWQEVKAQNNQIAAFKDPKTGNTITISRQVIPTEKTLEEAPSQKSYKPTSNFVINPPSGVQNDFKPVSTESGNAAGDPFTLNTYNTKINGTPMVVKELWLQKNNALYSVIYKGKPEDGSNIPFFSSSTNSKELDAIKKSLKVNNTTLKPTFVFGSISMPRLGVKWDIRSDSINSLNGVYHYSNSFYPGQDGSIGVVGHHTMYSAPMNHIENFQVGDKVYINDYLTQKRYTYHVVNTNDIRYDYETNKITFQPGGKELILATCWPPGRKSAEIYIHCQLDSVESL